MYTVLSVSHYILLKYIIKYIYIRVYVNASSGRQPIKSGKDGDDGGVIKTSSNAREDDYRHRNISSGPDEGRGGGCCWGGGYNTADTAPTAAAIVKTK
jgi:hypothetical protein